MRPHKEIVELGQRISDKVDKMSAKQMADAWNKSHPLGDKNPMKWTAKEVESNIPYHSMYLKGSLLEDELTEDEHSKYFAEGGETEFGVGGFILGLGAGVLGTKYLTKDRIAKFKKMYSDSKKKPKTKTPTKSASKKEIEKPKRKLPKWKQDLADVIEGEGAYYAITRVAPKYIKQGKSTGRT
jgi:hypothetical protein